MNNTSTGKPPTSQTSKKRLIIDEIGRDTKTGIIGRGYSPDNGKTFYVLDTIYGRLYGDDDIEAIWIHGVSDRVKSEVNSATAEIPGAIASANEAVKRADSAIANSKVNSDAIKVIQSAASEAKSDAQNATNIANALKSSVTDQLKNLDSTSKELDNARSEMTQYAKTAQDQGKDIADLKKSTAEITADVANTKGDVAELKINASATAVMASNNKSDITQLQVTASNASIDLQNAKSDIASFNATADKINTSIKDQDNRISTVEQTAKGIQATIGNQQNDINTIKQDATGMKETITNNQKQLTEINTSVDGLSTKVAGAVGKDFVESSIKQANDKINETITNLQGNLQNVTADLTGLQSTVKDKADQSQITQLSNLIQSKVSSTDFTSKISQLSNDINARVAKGDLISQLNMEAGQTLIQSKKLFLDADSVVFSGKAFIPDAAIENLSLDKLTTGNLAIPLQDSTGNSVVLNSKGVTISSPVASTRAYGFKNMQVTIGSGQMHLEGDLRNVHTGVTSHYQLGELLPVYDSLTKLGNAVDEKDDQTVGTAFMVDTLNSGKNGNFFALARSRENNSNPPYITGVVYNTTGEHREVGLHTFDPLYIHPYGADGYIQSTWVSWSNWNNGEKIPALTQAGSGWGGIGFPKSGQVSLFDDYGHVYQPQGGSGYTDYQHQYHL